MAFLLMAAAALMAAKMAFAMSVFAAKAVMRAFGLRATRLSATHMVAVVVVAEHRVAPAVQGCSWCPFPAASNPGVSSDSEVSCAIVRGLRLRPLRSL